MVVDTLVVRMVDVLLGALEDCADDAVTFPVDVELMVLVMLFCGLL
jgi:hypothetical protein